MGRLTLNILLSFAQFEREVIGERIRDKFRASRSRGMWMGGHPPLGYDVKDRKLVVNEAEAKLHILHFLRRVFAVPGIERLRAFLAVRNQERQFTRGDDREASRLITGVDVG